MNNIPKSKFGHPSWSQIEYNMYSRYIPNREVMNKVEKYVKMNNMCNASAMHVRITDLAIHLQRKRKHISLESYFNYVESREIDEPVYLLTDNPETQKLFLDKYGDKKILVYERIIDSKSQVPVLFIHSSNSHSRMKGTMKNISLPEDHRFTSLEHTVIDVLIAAHSKHFKSSGFSSLSELVKMFSLIGKNDRGWCR